MTNMSTECQAELPIPVPQASGAEGVAALELFPVSSGSGSLFCMAVGNVVRSLMLVLGRLGDLSFIAGTSYRELGVGLVVAVVGVSVDFLSTAQAAEKGSSSSDRQYHGSCLCNCIFLSLWV